MRITKKQLRRIIKEERARLEKQKAARRPLKESIADMQDYQELIERFADQLATNFSEDMSGMYDDEPDMFNQPRDEWEQEISAASNSLAGLITQAINKAVGQVEAELHDGQFSRR